MSRIANHLKYPPVKFNQKLPEKLIYYKKEAYDINTFKIFTTSKPHYSAEMCCLKKYDYLNDKLSLYISFLKATPRGKGLGTSLLNFAQKFSKKIGCDGSFFLTADPQFTPEEAPHIFYRKYGMNAESELVNKKIDKYIKSGQKTSRIEFPREKMYFPAIQTIPDKKENKSNISYIFKTLYIKLINSFSKKES